jgi:hypothetical protein
VEVAPHEPQTKGAGMEVTEVFPVEELKEKGVHE